MKSVKEAISEDKQKKMTESI
jgi:signal recognition particle subunit SRP54